MAHERWVKRMDDAVASSWLRGLRSSGREGPGSPPKRFVAGVAGASRAKAQLGKLERPIAANAER